MMAYTLRYQAELRNASDYFRDIKQTEISEDSLELAEALIAKRSAKFDPGKFEDGYEVAVKELVDAKVHNLPIPRDEAPAAPKGNVVNLMDALRQSLSSGRASSSSKKPVASDKSPVRSGMGLVKPAPKSNKRKSA
jgi:DNA end-binding protein Ku